jgi:hypothetical protein
MSLIVVLTGAAGRGASRAMLHDGVAAIRDQRNVLALGGRKRGAGAKRRHFEGPRGADRRRSLEAMDGCGDGSLRRLTGAGELTFQPDFLLENSLSSR